MFRLRFENEILGNKDFDYLPTNWRDIISNYIRSEKYHAISQRIEDKSFEFIESQAIYLRNAVELGAQTEIKVIFYYADNEVDFKVFYTGVIDLKSYVDKFSTVSCRVIPDSIESRFFNNIDTKYRIELDNTVEIPEILYEVEAEYETDGMNLDSYPDIDDRVIKSIGSGNFARFLTLPLDRKSGDSKKFSSGNINLFFEVFVSEQYEIDLYAAANTFCLYENTRQKSTGFYDIDLEFSIETDGEQEVKLDLDVLIYDKDGAPWDRSGIGKTIGYTVDSPSPWGGSRPWIKASWTVSYPVVTGFNMVKDTKIAVVLSPTGGSYETFYVQDITGTFKIKTIETNNDSTHKSILAKDLFAELCKKASGISILTDSGIFETVRYENTHILGGKSLRKKSTEAGALYVETSISEMFDCLNIPFCLGLFANSRRVELKLRDNYYKLEIVMTLDTVSEFEIEYDETIVYNELQVNYPSVDNRDRESGIFEFLTKYAYTLPSQFVDNTLDLSTGWKVDRTSLETQRERRLDDGETNSNEAEDNTIFVFKEDSPNDFEALTVIDGLQNDTYLFNIDFFAPAILRFWAWVIMVSLDKYAGTEILEIQKSEQNDDIDLEVTDESITENYNANDITIAKLLSIAKMSDASPDRNLFDPVLYKFNSPVTVEMVERFNYNRHGVIQVNYNGKAYFGYVEQFPGLANITGEFILRKLSKYGESLL